MPTFLRALRSPYNHRKHLTSQSLKIGNGGYAGSRDSDWPATFILAQMLTRVSAMGDIQAPYMDILQPYTDGHGPRHSHRHVRDCQPSMHGNRTHESFRASNYSGLPVAESRLIVYNLPNRAVTGHFTVVHDPLRTLSVLEPGQPGGCSNSRMSTVEETSRNAGCLYAQNGGFFNTHTNQCLGNVVSDGRMVRDSRGVQNAQFGIRRDGTLVFGYLSQEEVLEQSNPFVQLISGVMWLLRNGEVYINSSLKAECAELQESGSLDYFTNVISARSALGHDAEGRVILFQVDGQTGERGMSLWEMADFLKQNGVINAINMDGGGSSTFISNGTLANYPSDKCKADQRWRCARPVSTILCVHSRQVCTARGCVCDAGWRGKNCSQECLPGFYGNGCSQTCSCMNGGSCHHIHGGCSCAPGFSGTTCEEDGRLKAKEREQETRYLTETTWLTLTIFLSILLTLSLLALATRLCRQSPASRTRANYAYLPLTASEGEVPNGRGPAQRDPE